jgi:hypothetical protein
VEQLLGRGDRLVRALEQRAKRLEKRLANLRDTLVVRLVRLSTILDRPVENRLW